MSLENTKSLLTVDDVAKLLGVHINTVRNWIKKGDFPRPTAMGYFHFYKPEEVKEWLGSRNRKFQTATWCTY